MGILGFNFVAVLVQWVYYLLLTSSLFEAVNLYMKKTTFT